MDARGVGGVVHGPRVNRSAGRVPLRGYGMTDGRATVMDPMMMDRGAGLVQDPYSMGAYGPRDRSLDRLEMGGPRAVRRDRSLDRSIYLRDDHMGSSYRDPMMDDPSFYRDPMSQRVGVGGLSQSAGMIGDPRNAYSRDSFIMELQARLNELQNQYGHMKRELDATTQKLGSSMHSIKTFWSPELKKERALRKEEAAKYSLLSDQLKILRSENQVSYSDKFSNVHVHLHSSLRTKYAFIYDLTTL